LSRIIEVIVAPTGQSHVETKGFAGPTCRQASEFLEKALGQRQSEQLTAEFHQQSLGQSLSLQEGNRS